MLAAADRMTVLLGGNLKRFLFPLLVAAAVVVSGTAAAQYGYGMYGYDMYGNPIYAPNTYWNNPYGTMPNYGMDWYGVPGFTTPGYTLPQYGTDGMGGYTIPGYTLPGGFTVPDMHVPGYGMGGHGGVDPVQQQMDALQQQIDAYMVQQGRSFVDYYRQATGDYQTPDYEALLRGWDLWCSNNPVECANAQNTVSPEAQAWMDQSAALHQQTMMDNQQRFDMWWMGVQNRAASQDAWHQGFLKGVIQGE